VGWPSVKAILASKALPSYSDRRLARWGYEAQQTDEPASGERSGNLFESVPGDHAARGRFDARAKSSSVQLWLTTHGRWLGAAAALLALVILGALLRG